MDQPKAKRKKTYDTAGQLTHWAEDAKGTKTKTTYVETKADHQRMLDEGNRKAKSSGAYYQKKQEAAAKAQETGRKGWRGSISRTAFSDEYRQEAGRQAAAQRTKEHEDERKRAAAAARAAEARRRGG